MVAFALPAAAWAQSDSLQTAVPDSMAWHAPAADSMHVVLPPADSTHTLFEVGVAYDLTNEIHFDQPFDTTAIQPRQQVSEADGRIAALGAAHLDLRYARASYLLLDQLALIGPELIREQLHANWRHGTGSDWRWLGGADVDYRHDTAFGLTRDDLQGEARLGAERAPADYSSSLRMLYRFDLGNSQQQGDERIYPDFHLHRAQFSYAHFGTLGSEWSLGYTLGYRTFPDTSARNYLDHQGEAFGLVRFASGGEISARGFLDRRAALSDSATGDRFWQGEVEMSLRQPLSPESWWLTLGGSFFGTAYDVPTPAFFHNVLWRQSAQVRYEAGLGWALQGALEAEELRAPENGGLGDPDVSQDALNALREEYNQGSFRLGFERFGKTTFFVEPGFGRRHYLIEATPGHDLEAHSSYWFVGANGYADIRLARPLKLRGSADYLYEFHDLSVDDLSAIYVAAELRYALGR